MADDGYDYFRTDESGMTVHAIPQGASGVYGLCGVDNAASHWTQYLQHGDPELSFYRKCARCRKLVA